MIADIKKAWAIRYVRFGLLGTVMIALGSLTPAYLPQASPVWDVLKYLNLAGQPVKWIGTAIVFGGLLLLVDAWFRMRTVGGLRHWAVLLIWAIPFLLSPPIFSHDAYSYAAHGWLIQNGMNPYDVGPGTLPGAYADQVSWVWRFTPSPYGPLALRMSHWLCWLTGFDAYWSAVLMRVPALVGVGLIGFFLPKIARLRGGDHNMVGWLGILNPIVVIDFVGGAHNDALMVGLVVLAIWVTCRTRWWLAGAVVVGLAASIKQPALLAGVALPFLVSTWTSWRPKAVASAAARMFASLGVAVGVFAGISLATGFGFGWMNAVDVPGKVITVAPFTVVGWGIQTLLDMGGLDPSGMMAMRASRTLGMLAAASAIVYLGLRRLGTRPIYFLAWSYLWVAICAPALHAWYILWGGVLLPLTKPTERVINGAVLATLMMLSFAAINLSNRNEAWALGVAIVGGILGIVYSHFKRMKEAA